MPHVQNPARRTALQRLFTGAMTTIALFGAGAVAGAQPGGTRPRNPGGSGGQRPPDGTQFPPHDGSHPPQGGSRPGGPPNGGGQRPGDGQRPGGQPPAGGQRPGGGKKK